MTKRMTDRFTVEEAAEIYGLDNWGNRYLQINHQGHLHVKPHNSVGDGADLLQIIEDLEKRGVQTPVLLRFPQLLEGQVQELCTAFHRAIKEYNYQGTYRPVFPIKVNHTRRVVEGLLDAGWDYGLGIECGSRPEILGALALEAPEDSLLICNGYKDEAYLSTAFIGTRMGRNVIVVLEKPFELSTILKLREKNGGEIPMLGIRVKLQAKGSGLWEKSGGVTSKFGLSTRQLLDTVSRLREEGLLDKVALLHFHIGSQVTEIRKIKNAVREAARVYAKLQKLGLKVRYIDVGGGLGIDYDGSKTSSDASVNYSVEEYANDVVFGIYEVCNEERVPMPTIVSESGRALSAYHSVLIADVRGVIKGTSPLPGEREEEDDELPQVVLDLEEVLHNISVKNYRESYHDAQEYRDQMASMFNLGLIALEDRARAEALYWEIAQRAVRFSRTAKFQADEFQELEGKLYDKYICNFSVFQSAPDHWALDQLFPIMPIHRLNERPTERATLADITCDSDGEVDKFVDLKDIKEALEVHALREGEKYYLGFLLIGAYQDTMGDLHNLFGRVHSAEVLVDPDGRTVLRNVRKGERAKNTLEQFGFTEQKLVPDVELMLQARVEKQLMTEEEAAKLVDEYRERLESYTYLS